MNTIEYKCCMVGAMLLRREKAKNARLVAELSRERAEKAEAVEALRRFHAEDMEVISMANSHPVTVQPVAAPLVLLEPVQMCEDTEQERVLWLNLEDQERLSLGAMLGAIVLAAAIVLVSVVQMGVI